MAGKTAGQTRSVKSAKAYLTNMLRNSQKIPRKIMREEAVQLKADIIAITPYKTGRLRESVRVNTQKIGHVVTLHATASARDPETGFQYAGFQHEHEFRHYTTPGTRGHYISDPFWDTVIRIQERLAEEITD